MDNLPTHFYAHFKDGRWEPLAVHLKAVATHAAKFASAFGGEEWARLAGRWHDLGKYSAEFQRYLPDCANDGGSLKASRGPDHSTAGAQHAEASCPKGAGRILAYCIAGHHAGLPDATDAETGGQSGLIDRLSKTIPSFDSAPSKLLEAPNLPVPAFEWGKSRGDLAFCLSVFCRLLFSCLVDADFLATEQFMRPDRAAQRPGEAPALAKLLDRLDTYLAELAAGSKPSLVNVNEHRAAVLTACREQATLPPGLFSLTVPTGGGKTLSSLAFGLAHAGQHDLRRVIYAIPFTSIIEQNAKVFRDALAAAGDKVVLEHHSNFECKPPMDDKADGRAAYWDSLASENWDAPVVVTTNVQLFESLFASKPSRCRKLHRIAKSVIILDEVQTLPVHLLRPTLAMLDELCRNYGCSVVLCSATQPAITNSEGFDIGLQNVREIIDDVPGLFSSLKRVDVKRIGKIDDDALVARLAEHDRVLCVVNTRGHAAKLFHLLKDEVGNDVFHLSASMCAHHRTAVIRLIRNKLRRGDACRVISTQLIEAGVDIDFPIVYRAMTGVDAIAQAAGRCNREGQLNLGQVYVFDTDVDPRGDLRCRRQLGSEVAGLYDDILSLEAIEHYFKLIYWSQKDEWDKLAIMKCFSYSKRGLHAQFREAASKYRLIENEQQPVIVPYGRRGRNLVKELNSAHEPPGRDFSRRAQRFTVGVYPWQLERLRRATLVCLYHERYWVLEDPAAYGKELGLQTDLTGRNPKSLVI